MRLDTKKGLAFPALPRIEKWISIATLFLELPAQPAVQWLQVLGHLTSLEKLVPYGRVRIRPIQNQLRAHWSMGLHPLTMVVPLDSLTREAIHWWTQIPNLLVGERLGTIEIDHYLYTDSSLQGWGAHVLDSKASGVWSDTWLGQHINVLELKAIWLGLRAFADTLHNSTVAIMCDNTSAIAYVRKQGGTKSSEMSDLASQLCLWAEQHSMTLVPRHLPGHLNVVADQLSRRDQIISSEWSLNQSIVDMVFKTWGRPHVDLFALSSNRKLPTYFSPIWEKECWKVDCLVHSWEGMYAYAYPPTTQIRPALNKILSEGATVVMIAPLWPNQEWFPDLLSLTVDFPLTMPQSKRLLSQTFNPRRFHFYPECLNLHAWLLSPEQSKREAFLGKCPKESLFLKNSLQLDCMRLSGRFSESGAELKDLIHARPLYQ